MPDVSVIVPAFNAEKTLRRALDSIAAQGGVDWEIVVVDDGSQDATKDVALAFAAEHGRTRVISQPNRGRSSARNVGMGMARGNWLCFLDADDWYMPGALGEMLLQGAGCDIVWSAYGIQGCTVGELGCSGAVDPTSAIKAFVDPWGYEKSGGCYGIGRGVLARSACAKLFRATLVEGCGAVFPESLFRGEDGLFSLKCLAHAQSIGYVGLETYVWDVASSGTCRRFEQRHAQVLVDYAKTARLYLQEELRVGKLCEKDIQGLIAREAASTLSDAAIKGGSPKEAVLMLKQPFSDRDVLSSLDCLSSLSRARRLVWTAEVWLIRHGYVGGALMMERLGAGRR